MYLISLAIIFSILMVLSSGSIRHFIDPGSLIFILLTTIPLLAASGLLSDFRRGVKATFMKKAIYTLHELKRSELAVKLTMVLLIVSGLMATLIGMVAIANNTGMEINQVLLLVSMSVASLTTMYAIFLVLLLIPILYKIKALIIDEVENETDSK